MPRQSQGHSRAAAVFPEESHVASKRAEGALTRETPRDRTMPRQRQGRRHTVAGYPDGPILLRDDYSGGAFIAKTQWDQAKSRLR